MTPMAIERSLSDYSKKEEGDLLWESWRLPASFPPSGPHMYVTRHRSRQGRYLFVQRQVLAKRSEGTEYRKDSIKQDPFGSGTVDHFLQDIRTEEERGPNILSCHQRRHCYFFVMAYVHLSNQLIN